MCVCVFLYPEWYVPVVTINHHSVGSVQSVYVYFYTRIGMYQWLQSTTIVWVVYSLSMCISIPVMVCTSGYNQPP